MLVGKRLGGATLYHEVEVIDFDTDEVAIANSGEHDLAWRRGGSGRRGAVLLPCRRAAPPAAQPVVRG